jgi:hypothetical protein
MSARNRGRGRCPVCKLSARLDDDGRVGQHWHQLGPTEMESCGGVGYLPEPERKHKRQGARRG